MPPQVESFVLGGESEDPDSSAAAEADRFGSARARGRRGRRPRRRSRPSGGTDSGGPPATELRPEPRVAEDPSVAEEAARGGRLLGHPGAEPPRFDPETQARLVALLEVAGEALLPHMFLTEHDTLGQQEALVQAEGEAVDVHWNDYDD